jgi:hypothetical protein
VQVNSCEDGTATLFGRLGSKPLPDMFLDVDVQLAVGDATVVEQRKAADFERQ